MDTADMMLVVAIGVLVFMATIAIILIAPVELNGTLHIMPVNLAWNQTGAYPVNGLNFSIQQIDINFTAKVPGYVALAMYNSLKEMNP